MASGSAAADSNAGDGQVLPVEQRRYGQTALIRSAQANALWGATSQNNVGPLFLMAMGGNSFHVGLLSTLIRASWIGQILGLQFIGRFGKARMVNFGSLAALVPIVPMILVAAMGWKGPMAIVVAISSYAAVMFIRQVGQTGWWPLLQDVTAGDPRGAFFARMRTRLRINEVVAPLAVGFYLGQGPSVQRFTLVFCVGALGLLLGGLTVRKAPELPTKPPDANLLLRLRLASRDRNVRRYLLFVANFNFFLGMATPFWIVLFKQHMHLSDMLLVWLVAIEAAGHMGGLKLWGNIVDTHGGRSTLSMTIVGIAVMSLGWLLLPANTPSMVSWTLPLIGHVQMELPWLLIAWTASYYCLWGFLQGGYMMARTYIMIGTVPAVYQAEGMTLANLANFFPGALGSLLGSFIFTALPRGPVLWNLTWPVLYLMVVQMMVMLSWWSKTRLPGMADQTGARQLMAAAWKRMTRGSIPTPPEDDSP